MAKAKRMYGCTECGATFPKWAGQCGECGAWNTLVEALLEANAATPSGRAGWAGEQAQLKTLAEVSVEEVPRFSTASGELDRVLGGGLVDGSVVLIGGDPGIGKSTILLQTLCNIATRFPALYVTGEESQQQVAMRARRLGLPEDKLKVMTETCIESIIATAASPRYAKVRRCWCALPSRAAQRFSWSATSPRKAHWQVHACLSTWSTPCCISRASPTADCACCAR
jgi:DNA repair protein RadA/Sms